MKRTTLFASEDLIDEIKNLAIEENRSVAALTREAIEQYIARKKRSRKTLSFIGIGQSKHRNVAVRHEELLWQNSRSPKR